ncbi:MAG: dihydrolipoamide acetyltransferase family protein [Solirubrobacteraceae bacterium]|jgi:pyruvate dehydrogenase E2 component (dihydrolipoamide acetyltransferase)
MSDVVMPRLSDTMEEGTILRWLLSDGSQVRRGQELVEIETDKATMIYESDLEGTLSTLAAEGETLPVGAIIARVGERPRAEDQMSTPGAAPALADEIRARPAPPPSEAARETPGASAVDASASTGERRRVKASPLARRIARERGLDLQRISGSGPQGRVLKTDIEALAAEGQPLTGEGQPTGAQPRAGAPEAGEGAPSSAAALAGVATAKGETSTIELSRTQQTIARRMAESKATIPHFTLQAEVDMQACVALRAELKSLASQAPEETSPTYNDMVVKAAALALREHPRVNSSYRDGRLALHARVNVGVAVAAEAQELSGGALIVPTVFDADRKSLGEIARETRALAARVREGSITPPELGGGTFTVSNLGMFGIRSFTAIINPPQTAILSVGSVEPRAVVHEGQLQARQSMTLTLACDHRMLYGADAARFLARIRDLLESPSALTL